MKQKLVPKRSYLACVLVMIFCLFTAPTVGVITSFYLAPGSVIALFIGLIWLLASYKIAYYAWMFIDFMHDPKGNVKKSVKALKGLGRDLSNAIKEGNTEWSSSDDELNCELPKGRYAFIIVFGLCGLSTGAFVGLFLSKLTILTVTIGYTSVSTAFAAFIYLLVRLGYFPITDELFEPE